MDKSGGGTGYNDSIMPTSGTFINTETTIILDNVINRTKRILYGGKKR